MARADFAEQTAADNLSWPSVDHLASIKCNNIIVDIFVMY